MTDYISQAVTGTEAYHEVMRQAAKAGLQRKAGYVADKLDTEPYQGKQLSFPVFVACIREDYLVSHGFVRFRAKRLCAEIEDILIIAHQAHDACHDGNHHKIHKTHRKRIGNKYKKAHP